MNTRVLSQSSPSEERTLLLPFFCSQSEPRSRSEAPSGPSPSFYDVYPADTGGAHLWFTYFNIFSTFSKQPFYIQIVALKMFLIMLIEELLQSDAALVYFGSVERIIGVTPFSLCSDINMTAKTKVTGVLQCSKQPKYFLKCNFFLICWNTTLENYTGSTNVNLHVFVTYIEIHLLSIWDLRGDEVGHNKRPGNENVREHIELNEKVGQCHHVKY